MSSLRLPALALALALLPALARAGLAAPADGPACGLSSGFTLVGFDTASGAALFSLAGHDGGSYLALWKQGAASARLFREPDGTGRFGGSIGPGPVFVFRRCGEGCLQPLRFDAGTWKPLGEPLLAPTATTVHATYDRSGTPWVVLYGSSERPGFARAWAFRLEGREWHPAGRLDVTAVGVPGALPAPWFPRAVVTGTGLFPAEGEPRTWVSGLPAGRGGPGAQVIAFDRRAAAFISPEGSIYRSADAGQSWRLSSWSPWSTGEAEPWKRGDDFSVDLPMAIASDVLPVLWFDRRIQGRESLIFTEMTPAGRWRQVAVGPARIPTSAGEDLPVSLVLRGDDGRWSSVFGCVTSAGQPRLVAVELAGGRVGERRLVPLQR